MSVTSLLCEIYAKFKLEIIQCIILEPHTTVTANNIEVFFRMKKRLFECLHSFHSSDKDIPVPVTFHSTVLYWMTTHTHKPLTSYYIEITSKCYENYGNDES